MGSVGFSVIAAIRSGKLQLNCNDCQGDPDTKKNWGCDSSTQFAVWADNENEFYNCPLKFITPEHYDFLEEYDFNNRHNVSIDIKNVPCRYLEAEKYLSTMTSWYSSAKTTHEDKEQSTIMMLKGKFDGSKH